MLRSANLHSIIQNGVILAAAARRFGDHKSTASQLLARCNDTGDVRNKPPLVDITQWKIGPANLRYRDKILLAHAFLYAGAIANGLQLVDDNARPHRGHEENEFLDQNISDRTQWPSKSSDF